MTEGEWLVDKSALARLSTSPDATSWARRVSRGVVHVTSVTLLEVGYSAQSLPDWRARVRGSPMDRMPLDMITPASERRAVEVQGLLAAQAQHRAPSIPDLMIAAIAEVAGLTVLHVDKDFELIATITGQPTERLRLAR